MNTSIAPFIALLITVLASCTHSAAPSPTTETNFWPLTQGSSWTYEGISSYTLTVAGDSTINGTLYTKAAKSSGGYDLFRMSDGGMLYARESDGSEIPLLLNNAPLGKTWAYTRTVRGATLHYQHTVAEVQGIRTVNSTTYNNVVKIDVYEIEKPHNGEHSEHTEQQKKLVMSRYYAHSVGLIESDAGVWGKFYLTKYSIK